MGTASFMHAYMFCQHNTNELSTIIFLLLDYVAYVSYYMDFLATRFFFSLFYYFYFIYTPLLLSHRQLKTPSDPFLTCQTIITVLVSNSYHHLLSESHIIIILLDNTCYYYYLCYCILLLDWISYVPKAFVGTCAQADTSVLLPTCASISLDPASLVAREEPFSGVVVASSQKRGRCFPKGCGTTTIIPSVTHLVCQSQKHVLRCETLEYTIRSKL